MYINKQQAISTISSPSITQTNSNTQQAVAFFRQSNELPMSVLNNQTSHHELVRSTSQASYLSGSSANSQTDLIENAGTETPPENSSFLTMRFEGEAELKFGNWVSLNNLATKALHRYQREIPLPPMQTAIPPEANSSVSTFNPLTSTASKLPSTAAATTNLPTSTIPATTPITPSHYSLGEQFLRANVYGSSGVYAATYNEDTHKVYRAAIQNDVGIGSSAGASAIGFASRSGIEVRNDGSSFCYFSETQLQGNLGINILSKQTTSSALFNQSELSPNFGGRCTLTYEWHSYGTAANAMKRNLAAGIITGSQAVGSLVGGALGSVIAKPGLGSSIGGALMSSATTALLTKVEPLKPNKQKLKLDVPSTSVNLSLRVNVGSGTVDTTLRPRAVVNFERITDLSNANIDIDIESGNNIALSTMNAPQRDTIIYANETFTSEEQ